LKPLHICELNMPIEYYSPISGGAVSTVIMQRAKHLIARGHRVSILAPQSGDPQYDVGNVVPLFVPQRESLSRVRRALSHFRNQRNHWEWPFYEYYIRSFSHALKNLAPAPDVVITHNDLIAARFIKKVLPSTPVVSWLHNEMLRPAHDIKKTIPATNRFVGVSRYIQNWTAQKYPGLADKITFLHNGVDEEAFFPRDDFLKFSPPLRVLFVGRLSHVKGPDLAADAVAQLNRENIALRFTVAGGVWWHGVDDNSDPFFRELKPKMEAAGAEFIGQVARPDVPGLMREHDVVCLLSRFNDPCPLVALEALGAGCVALASRRGGLPEICGDAAVYADPDAPETIATALRRLANEPEFLREHKEKSRTRAMGLSWRAHAGKLETLLHEIVVSAR
jgi:glycosyltransferase involved in cell wall biosynthesis